MLAFGIASPWVFYQMWAFVAAGLYPHEKRYVYTLLPASVALFLAGVVLCQLVVLPSAVRALLTFNDWAGYDPDLRLPAELGLHPARIAWNTDTKVFVTTADNRTVIFGSSANLDSKLQVLGTLLKDNTPFTTLDLRPSTPFFRNDAPAAPTEATTPPQ